MPSISAAEKARVSCYLKIGKAALDEHGDELVSPRV